MSKNISLDEIKKFWPEKAPDINIVEKYVKKYEKEKIVIKYGGNVLILTEMYLITLYLILMFLIN